VREMLEMLKRKLEEESYLDFLGAGIFITGGTSQLKGINHLAQEVFEMPVHLTHAQTVAGVTSVSENPQFSTAIGLIRYAQATQTGRRRGLFSWLPIFKRTR
jgi:cell division protein FtsA